MKYLIVTTVILIFIGIKIWWSIYKGKLHNESMLTEIQQLIQANSDADRESKLSVTRGIQVYLKALTIQKDALQYLVDELEFEQELVDYDEVEKIKELAKLVKLNRQSLEKTEEAISQLETWYFTTHGRHYTLPNDMRFFQDTNGKISKN